MSTNLAQSYGMQQCDFCGEESESSVFITIRIISMWVISETEEKHYQQEEHTFCTPECLGKHFACVGSDA